MAVSDIAVSPFGAVGELLGVLDERVEVRPARGYGGTGVAVEPGIRDDELGREQPDRLVLLGPVVERRWTR